MFFVSREKDDAEVSKAEQGNGNLSMIRYGFGVVVFMVLLGLGWRVAAVAQTNLLHHQLLKLVMQGESGSLPESAEGVTGLTARAAAQLQPDEAQVWLESGLSDYSQSLTALELCLWYWDAGRVADAAAACRQGHVTAEYWLRLGLPAESGSNWAAAIPFYEMATQVDPTSGIAWHRLGTRLVLDQQYERAISAFQQAVSLGFAAYTDLGQVYLQTGDLVEARKVLLAGIEIYPESQYAYFYLAQIAEAEEDWLGANEWYEQLARVSPDYGPAYSGRGRIAVRLGEYDQAVAYFQQATQVEPNGLGNWLALAAAAAQAGDTPLAVQAYEQALLLQPDNAQAQAGLEALGQP